MMNRFFLKYFPLGVLLSLIPFAVKAEDRFYVGARGTSLDWDVGVVDQMSTNAKVGRAIGQGITTEETKTKMTMGGLLLAYLRDNSSLSYVGSAGHASYHNQQVFQNFSPISFQYIPISANVRVVRYDHDLTYAHRLGDSGFSAFGAVKAQGFSYDAKPVPGMGPYRTTPSSGNSFSGTNTVFASPNFTVRTAGPALGVIYAFRINPSNVLTLQLAGIYLRGEVVHELVVSQTVTTPGVSGSPLIVFNSFGRSTVSQKVAASGYTVGLGYSFQLAESTILMVSALHQESTLNGKKASFTGYGYTSNLAREFTNATTLDQIFAMTGIIKVSATTSSAGRLTTSCLPAAAAPPYATRESHARQHRESGPASKRSTRYNLYLRGFTLHTSQRPRLRQDAPGAAGTCTGPTDTPK